MVRTCFEMRIRRGTSRWKTGTTTEDMEEASRRGD